VKYPVLGQIGYEFLRVTGVDRSTRGTKRFFRKLARHGFNPKVILDIGANYGGWSRTVRSVFKDAHFFLIEPQEEMQPFLDRFCAHAPGSKWYLAGAGAEKGKLLLTIWDDLQGSAFLTPEIQSMTPYVRQRSVPVVTIDGLVAEGELPTPDLVKIDVQGFELEVLRGSIGCLGRTDVFIVETSFFHPLGDRASYYRVTELMEAYGYHIYDLSGQKYRSGDDALVQVDICFVRDKSLLRPAR
jgi:FkbM family methyltransferase